MVQIDLKFMLLSIVVLNYQKAALTIDCIRSLYSIFEKQFKNNVFELIIVDNASGDNSSKIFKDEIKAKNYFNIKIIENSENAGFSKGCNTGAEVARGAYLLFLNNDTIITDMGIFEMCSYIDNNSNVGILGGQLCDSNGKNQPSTGKFYNLKNAFLLLLGMQKYGVLDISPTKIEEVDWVKGALLMVRKEIFNKLKGFDENIFMYTEDMEFCYRAKTLGYHIFFYPELKVLHLDQGSSNRSFAVVQIYKGMLYFYKKHRSYLEYSLIKSMLVTKALVAIMIGTLTGNKYLTSTFRKAIQF